MERNSQDRRRWQWKKWRSEEDKDDFGGAAMHKAQHQCQSKEVNGKAGEECGEPADEACEELLPYCISEFLWHSPVCLPSFLFLAPLQIDPFASLCVFLIFPSAKQQRFGLIW